MPTDMDGFWTFRIKPGQQLRFDDLLYGRAAVDLYGVFRRLRDEGVIPSEVRFQVSLPTPHSAVDPYFDDREQWDVVYAAYLAGIQGEIGKILDVAPATDLVFQWDCANEIVDIAMGEANSMKWYPKPDGRREVRAACRTTRCARRLDSGGRRSWLPLALRHPGAGGPQSP